MAHSYFLYRPATYLCLLLMLGLLSSTSAYPTSNTHNIENPSTEFRYFDIQSNHYDYTRVLSASHTRGESDEGGDSEKTKQSNNTAVKHQYVKRSRELKPEGGRRVEESSFRNGKDRDTRPPGGSSGLRA
ncbi:hypothetical protein BDF19DRAFT_430250 [Syncephalis fuscata]|nr:hypothetical protein BDF19DRAFT_459762 [Syncephalis fuscata]KAI9599152.1 hypothetical protein BDF19DRAFT_430250 [Syncephalis fuscata]